MSRNVCSRDDLIYTKVFSSTTKIPEVSTILSRHLMIPEFKIKDKILFFLHLNLVTQKELIDMDKQGEIVQFTNVIKDQINPFILSEELMMSARRNIQLGFYKETIINAQTSIETLLRTLYMELLKLSLSAKDISLSLISSISILFLLSSLKRS